MHRTSKNNRAILLFVFIALTFLFVKCNNDSGTNADGTDPGFRNVQQVSIIGYSGNIRNPFISKDDKYLFFNGTTNNYNIYYAEKVDDITFTFKGELQGVNSSAGETNPTMDADNNFYFISNRDLDSTHNATIFAGIFNNGTVSNLHKVNGTINSPNFHNVNLDVNVSSDGNTLFTTNVMFNEDFHDYKTDINFALKNADDFNIPDNMSDFLININTQKSNASYAEISSDGLELFYSQFTIPANGSPKLCYAKRKNIDLPFSAPVLITEPYKADSIAFIYAPTLSGNGKKLYYQKSISRNDRLYMISRD